MTEKDLEKRIASNKEIRGEFEEWWPYLECILSTPEEIYKEDIAWPAFLDGWQRAENHLLDEPISKFIEQRIHEIFSEAKEKERDKSLNNRLIQGEETLVARWQVFCKYLEID